MELCFNTVGFIWNIPEHFLHANSVMEVNLNGAEFGLGLNFKIFSTISISQFIYHKLNFTFARLLKLRL